jgi:predicted membrane protein
VSSRTFGYHKLHIGLSFALERIGPLAAIIIAVFYLLALYLFALPNTPENLFASIYSESLIKTTYQHLLLLVGFDTLIYRKYYDIPPIRVGHQDYFLALLPRSEALCNNPLLYCIFSSSTALFRGNKNFLN